MKWDFYECCNCGWTGKQEEKLIGPDISGLGEPDICPNCYNEDFYDGDSENAGQPINPCIRFGNFLAKYTSCDGDTWWYDENPYNTMQIYKVFIQFIIPITK